MRERPDGVRYRAVIEVEFQSDDRASAVDEAEILAATLSDRADIPCSVKVRHVVRSLRKHHTPPRTDPPAERLVPGM